MKDVVDLNSVALQAARWASEAHVAAQRMNAIERVAKTYRSRKRKARTGRFKQFQRRKITTPRTLQEELPAQIIPPLNHTEYFNPMDLFGHRLYIAAVAQTDGRHTQGHIAYCQSCGA